MQGAAFGFGRRGEEGELDGEVLHEVREGQFAEVLVEAGWVENVGMLVGVRVGKEGNGR